MRFMKKETTKYVKKILERSIGTGVDVNWKKYKDGTEGFILKFKNLKLKEQLEHDAKEAGLTPEGYVKACIFYKDEKTLKDIVTKSSLKNKSKK